MNITKEALQSANTCKNCGRENNAHPIVSRVRPVWSVCYYKKSYRSIYCDKCRYELYKHCAEVNKW